MSAVPVLEPLRRAERAEPRRLPRAEPSVDAAQLLDHAGIAIACTRDRSLLRCNRGFELLFGYGAGELVGRSLMPLYPSYGDYMAWGRTSYRQIGSQGSCRDERLMRRRDGSLFWCEVTGRPLDASRPDDGCVWTLTDISERRAAEEQQQAALETLEQRLVRLEAELQQARADTEAARQVGVEQARRHHQELARASRLNTMGEMAGALAHELAQPIAATLNYLHGCQLRLQHEDCTAAQLGAALGQAIQHTETAGGIVRQVRSFVRRHVPETTATDLHALLRQMLGLLEHERRALGVRTELQLADAPPMVMVDALEIRQVLLNLLRNALEAMADSPAGQRLLRIETRQRDDGRIEVLVRDSGPGIAEELRSRLFEAYFTTKQDGLGLGLAVCRSIIESHDGALSAEANPEGGACFRFDLHPMVHA